MSIIDSGNPTVGLYFNNKLVSWAVTYPDGSSGMLYTLEPHRRRLRNNCHATIVLLSIPIKTELLRAV